MRASTQFITGVRIVLLLAAKPAKLHRSGDVGRCLGINPVIVRRALLRLCDAGIVLSKKGPGGGSQLARKAEEITLRDVYRAVSLHAKTLPAEKTGTALKAALSSASRAFEDELARTTFAQLLHKSARAAEGESVRSRPAAMVNSR